MAFQDDSSPPPLIASVGVAVSQSKMAGRMSRRDETGGGGIVDIVGSCQQVSSAGKPYLRTRRAAVNLRNGDFYAPVTRAGVRG